MTDNNQQPEEIKEETAPAVNEADTESLSLSESMAVEPEAPKNDMDDLPEDVRKKLEKRAALKAKPVAKGAKGKKRKKKVARKVPVGKAYINSTYNNTIVTLTDTEGNVLSWASAGIAGFKGAKKATPYAAQIIAKIAIIKAKEDYGLSEVSVFVKGVGTGRESAVRSLNANGLNVTYIKDVTPVPHNGCRPRKPRRV